MLEISISEGQLKLRNLDTKAEINQIYTEEAVDILNKGCLIWCCEIGGKEKDNTGGSWM